MSKTFFRILLGGATGLFWFVLLYQMPLFAVTSSTGMTVSSLVTSATTIKDHSLQPVFKIQFGSVESGETLQQINLIFNSSATPNAVLEDPRVYDGGWQLWKDSSSGTSGTFEHYSDQQILLSSSNLSYGSDSSYSLVPDSADSMTANDIYYVVIKTDDTGLSNGTDFTLSLKANGVTTSGATQPTNSIVTTSNMELSVTPKCVKIELLDGSIAQGNRLRITFNSSIDFSYVNSYGLSNAFYDNSWSDSSEFGTGATYSIGSDGGASNDSITITFGSSPTLTNGSILYYSVGSTILDSYGYYTWAWGSKTIDTTAPTLMKAELITDAGSDGQANDIGDQIAFMFSESMDTSLITANNINTVLQPSSGDYNSSGAKPSLNWWGESILVVTLKNNLTTNLIGKTVTPSISLKNLFSNAIDISQTPSIAAATLTPVSSVVLSDIDTANSWLDKNDIGVEYTIPAYGSNITSDADFHIDIYLLPEGVGLDPSSMYRINSANLTQSSAGTYSFDGADSDYSLYYDSRTNFPAIQNNDWSNIQYYSIDSNQRYVAYVVVSTDAHSSETSSSRSIPRPSDPLLFTSDPYTSDTTAPWISSYSPNTSSASISTKTFTMTWSEALLQSEAEDINNYTLKYDKYNSDGQETPDWIYESTVDLSNASVTYDNENFMVTLKLPSNADTLEANKSFFLQVDSEVEDLYGTSVGSWAGFYFQTGSTQDNASPTVSSSTISNGATDVSPYLSSIIIKFNEAMDPSTINSTSATLDPSVPDVNIVYESSTYTLKYTFGNTNLLAETEYTFTLDANTVADTAGNLLDGDISDGSDDPGTDYTLNFTTRASTSADTTAPRISWSSFDGYTLYVGFNAGMKESDVEEDTNWTLTCDDVSQSLNWATFTYDDYNYELSVTGLYCSSGADYTITASSNIRGSNNTVIDSSYDSSSGTVTSSYASTGSYGDTSSSYYSYWSPISVWPSDNSAATETYYYISMPLTNALSNGYQVVIDWPSGFDISGATVRAITGTNPSYSNSDLNGSWTGLYDSSSGTSYSDYTYYPEGVIRFYDLSPQASDSTVTSDNCPSYSSCIDNDTIQNRMTLTTWNDFDNDGNADSNAVTGSTDYISFEIDGVINGPANEVNYSTGNGGYTLTVSTRTAAGAPLQSEQQSSSFSIMPAGTGTLTCSVTETSSGDPVSGATCYSYGTASKSCTTETDGTCTINNVQDGTWWFWINSPSGGQYTNDYSDSSSSCSVNTTNSDTSDDTCTYSAKLKRLTTSISGTISYDASELLNKQVVVWVWGDNSYSSVVVTLDEEDGTKAYTAYTSDSSGGGSDDSTSSSSSTSSSGGNSGSSKSKREIGIYEQTSSNSFTSPASKQVDVSLGSVTGVNFTLVVPSNRVTITVLDGDGNGISSAWVSMSCYDSGCGYGNYGSTGSSGTITLKVSPGDYNVSVWTAYGSGEQAVSIASDGTVTPTGGPVFVFGEPNATITGTVLDELESPIAWASINYLDSNGQSFWSSTNQSGEYSLWVTGGTGVTGTIIASSWQHGGKLPPDSGVDVTDFEVASNAEITGKNFQYDPSAYATISGRIIADSSGVQWAGVSAEEVNMVTGRQMGRNYDNWTSTDADGNYTMTVTKNDFGITCYDLYAWEYSYGELSKKSCIDVSSANVTGQNWDLGSIRTLTITVTGAPDVTQAYLDIKQDGIDSGIWTTVDLANGSGTATLDIMDGTYTAKLTIPGFGEVNPDSSNSSGFTVSANKSLDFTLTSLSTDALTVTGTVTDTNSNPVSGARVTFYDSSTGEVNSTKTDSEGDYSILLLDGDYSYYASKSSYGNSPQETVNASGDYDLTLTAAATTISGTVRDSNNDLVSDAFVIASNDDQWSFERTDGVGAYSLSLPDTDSTWNIEVMTGDGYRGTASNVSEGTSALSITADEQYVTGLAADAATTSAVESQSFSLDDDDIGVKIQAPVNTFNDSSGEDTQAGILSAKEIAVPTTISESIDVISGSATEITLIDSQNVTQTQLQATVGLTFTFTKEDIDADVTAGLSQYDDWTENPTISYLEESTQSWATMPTTCTAQVQLTSSSSSTTADCDTVANNIASDEDTYYDYSFVLYTGTDHFTVFGVTIPTDNIAPSAPTGLTATKGNLQVVLDWNNNSESDLLEYNVYRSTSSTVTLTNANQVNTASVTSSAFTDSTVSNDTKYYYVVTAVDTSSNESSVSNTVNATPSATADTTAPSAPTGLSATAGNASVTLDWSNNSEGDLQKYNVYRSTSSTVTVTSANKINSTNVTSSAYTDSTVTNGTKYYYVVTAIDDSNNESSASSTVNATPSVPSTTTTSTSTPSSSPGGGSSRTSDDEDETQISDIPSSVSENDEGTETERVSAEAIEALPFLDTVGHWAQSFIAKLYSRGVVSGYDFDTYGPNNSLTRAELSKIALNSLGVLAPNVDEAPFLDVASDSWYAPYVAKMKELGVIEGYSDGTFKPDQTVNRAEAMKILLKIKGKDDSELLASYNPFSDVNNDSWYAKYVLYAYEEGYVSGYRDEAGNLTGKFGPENTITRGEMAKIVSNVMGW